MMQASYITKLFSNADFVLAFNELTSYRGELCITSKGLQFYTQNRDRLGIPYETSVEEVIFALKAHLEKYELSVPLLLEAQFINSEEGYWYRKALCGNTLQIWKDDVSGLWHLGGDFSTKPCPLQGKGTLKEMIALAVTYADKVRKETLYGPHEIANIISKSLVLCNSEFPRETTQLFFGWIDSACYDGAFNAIGDMLAAIDTDAYLPSTLTGVLMFTYPVKDELGDSRVNFFNRVAKSFEDKHQMGRERIDHLLNRFR